MNPLAEQALARSLKRLEIPDMTPVATIAPPPGAEDHGDYDSRTADKFVMRLPEGMRQKVSDRARQEHRSMNGVLINATQQYLDGQEELRSLLDSVKFLKRALEAALSAAQSNQEASP